MQLYCEFVAVLRPGRASIIAADYDVAIVRSIDFVADEAWNSVWSV